MPRPFRCVFTFLVCTLAQWVTAAVPASSETVSPAPEEAATASHRLKELSLEELMSLEVSTVSRKTESWWSAPGAIDVITGEDLRRDGSINIPDALRMATGLHVGQTNAREWAISARGFNILAANKMSVQMDGRSLYTPFFSGVIWDVQDTLMEDIDRIEVLRGPGGALWGAYAVNGFIQILTKPAWETQGWLASAIAGTENPGSVSVRYGDKVGDHTFYRAYAKYTQYNWSYLNGVRSNPSSDMVQAGFRSDSRSDADTTLTFLGDIYTNKGTPRDNAVTKSSGGNLGTQWRRVLDLNSDVQLAAYYDHTSRVYGGPFFEDRDSLSASAKYRTTFGAHEVQIGTDTLVSWDKITSPSTITIQPPERTYTTVGIFIQDTISFVPNRWVGTIGLKAEHTSFAGDDVLPTLRLAWTPTRQTTVWAALSRAVRPPVRVDEGLLVKFGDTVVFQGNENLKSETVLAAELGIRRKITDLLAVDLAGFASSYDDVRSYDNAPTVSTFPWTFGNSLNARTSGIEATVLYQPLSRVFIKAGYRYLDLVLTKDPGSRDFRNGLFEANDARHVGTLTVRTNVGRGFEFDTTLRYASGLSRPTMKGYATVDLRFGWAPSAAWDISLIGRNLTDSRHSEFVATNSSNEEIARSVALKVTWRH